MRALFSNYLSPNPDGADINGLGGGPIASSRALFDEEVGVAASDLTHREVRRLQPRIYERMAQNGFSILKTHDAYVHNQDKVPLFRPDLTRAAVYIIRNPLDVAVSFAHHNGCTLGQAVRLMGDPGHQLAPRIGSLPPQLPQDLGTWSEHVNLWLQARDIRLHVVRYEDLKSDTAATFAQVLRFLDLPEIEDRLEAAVQASSFEKLKQQEQERGFRERPSRSKEFFRQGRVGGWRAEFDKESWQKVLTDHFQVMERFDYIKDSQWEDDC